MDRGHYFGQVRPPPHGSFYPPSHRGGTGAVAKNASTNDFHKKRQNNRKQQTNSSQSSQSLSATTSVSSDKDLRPPKQPGRKYVCRGCDIHYDYYLDRNNIFGRIPCILPCGHTLCQECINSMRVKNQIECSVCHESIEKKQQTDYNHYILGHIATSKMAGSDIPDVKLCSTKQNEDKAGFCKDFVFKCASYDCRNIGTTSCLNCFKLYCNECDDKIHDSGISDEIHMRNKYGKVPYELTKCPHHKTYDQEILCITCQERCCFYCFLDKHESHKKEYLKKLDRKEEKQLEEAYDIISSRVEDLQRSQKMTRDSNKVINMENEITTQFADIHAKLYLIEKKLLKEAKQRSVYEHCNEGDTIITAHINSMRHILQCFDERESTPCNMRALLATFMELKEISTPSKFSYDRNAKFIIDPKLNKLEDFFELVTPYPQTLPLFSEDDLDENSSETGSSLRDLEISVKRVPEVHETVKMDMAAGNTGKISLTRQIVCVTHVNSANCFYVQSKECSEQFRNFEKSLKHHVNKTSTKEIKIEQNKLYLAPTMASSVKWGRAKVLEQSKEDRKWTVFFIDFGHIGTVGREELKGISVNFLSTTKPFAVKCMLFNPSESEWDDKEHSKLKEILSVNQEVIMIPKRILVDTYLVELFVSDSSRQMFPISDLIMDDDSINLSLKETVSNTSIGSNQIFENTDTFSVGQSYEIVMRYVLDPFHIFIQKVSYESVLRDMINSLEKHYEHSKCDVYLPVEGSDVVIFYSSEDYGNWHRGRVQNVENATKHANVFLVDWGKRVNVRWSDMRKLIGQFQGTECLVFCAQLADINPKSDDGWLSKDGIAATNFLETYCVKPTILKMLVSESEPLKIALFERKIEFDENINALLVEKDLAVCRGKLSTTLKWPLKKQEEEELDGSEFFPIQKSFSDSDDTDEEIEGIKLRVKLIRFVDPYQLYISIDSRKMQSERLFEELQIHYKQQKIDVMNKTWSVNENVVVFNEVERDYFRAVIEKIDKNNYYVYLLDVGNHMNVEGKNLRPILPYFTNKFPNAVLRCHLANIKPAGDTKKWSSTSIEWFERMFIKHTDIFIQKIENDDSKTSLPITMWYSKVIQGSALEPSIYRYFSVEMKAVAAGLAFQIKKTPRLKKTQVVQPSQDVEPKISLHLSQTDIHQEQRNCNRITTQWLPPLPFTRTEFDAAVTCVEGRGYLYLRDEQIQSDYRQMELLMKKHFDSREPGKPFQVYVNQMVTLWSEEIWYRGLVLEIIDEETVRVMMVDFGSDHIVKTSNIQKRIMYTDIPIFTKKVCLHDVVPVSQESWTTRNTDMLMEEIPEVPKVVIRTNGRIPSVDIYDKYGKCFNDTFVVMCENLHRLNGPTDRLENETLEHSGNELQRRSEWTESTESLFGSEPNSPSITNYIFVRPTTLPGQHILCDFISVCKYNIVSLFYKSDESREKEFRNLSASIQMEAPDLEPLTKVTVGAPCISLFQSDQTWYRAQIFETTDDDQVVHVFYVDYGNFESVLLSDIRMMKSEWLSFPAYCSIARINYKLMNTKNEDSLLNLLAEQNDTKVDVEVTRDNPFCVNLYNKKGDLIYNTFVENGTVLLL